MFDIPITVQVNGQSYAIRNNGDFRMVLDCFVALNDADLDKQERVYAAMIIFYDGFTSVEDFAQFGKDFETAVKEMYKFFNCGIVEESTQQLPQLINWETDAQLIASAINKVAGKEIRVPENVLYTDTGKIKPEYYIHWWTFMGYYTAIGQSALSTVVSIRYKTLRGDKLEKWERKFKAENPEYFKWNPKTLEEQELDNLAKQMWNSGS